MASNYHIWRRNNVHYEKKGLGDPILLIHNIHPGASHQEFRRNVDYLARTHTVYAIDLLGFGDSDAPRRRYTARLYIDLIQDFCREVIRQRTDVVAAGLSCAYVSQAASEDVCLFGYIVFICPRSEPTGLELPRWAVPIRHFSLATRGLGSGFYETVTSSYSLSQYLLGCFHNPKAVTKPLVELVRANARREGSMYAYAGLLVGYLDWPLLKSLPKVASRILLIWGRQARPTPVEHSVRLVAMARRCNLRVIEEAGAWVHDEQSAQVNRLIEQFTAGEIEEAPARKVEIQ